MPNLLAPEPVAGAWVGMMETVAVAIGVGVMVGVAVAVAVAVLVGMNRVLVGMMGVSIASSFWVMGKNCSSTVVGEGTAVHVGTSAGAMGVAVGNIAMTAGVGSRVTATVGSGAMVHPANNKIMNNE